MVNKQWIDTEISNEEVELLASKLGKSTLICKLLLARGLRNAEEIQLFLNPALENMYDPFLLKDMDAASDRIFTAIKNDDNIIIYGDYDVDGITGTSILYSFLTEQGAHVEYYIPDRLEEGYGLSIDALEKIMTKNPGLILTVDCGITAIDEVKYVKKQGVDIVITDHHECGDILPDAYAVVNPCRHDCTYPFKELAGVGVAYKLIQALCIRLGLGDSHQKYLDLTALGTIADVVSLLGENRIIVKHGIERIAQTNNVGLHALIECSGLKDKPVSTGSIAFGLAPRVNAAGRLGDAGRGVELFTTESDTKAHEIALNLNEENLRRQKTQSNIYEQVEEIIKSELDLQKDIVILASSKEWHSGVIGIVASKITEKYHRPCILICDEDGTGKGSGRSIEGFNIFNALKHCEGILLKYGGHELAAGLSIKMDSLEEFKCLINDYARENMNGSMLVPAIKVDAALSRDEINIDSVRELEMLSPFGIGNPRPVFAYSSARIKQIKTVGQNKHLKMVVEDRGFLADAIGFNMGEAASCYDSGDYLDVAFNLEINTWNSVQKVQMSLKDIKPACALPAFDEYMMSLDKYIEFEGLNSYNSYNELLIRVNDIDERSRLSLVSNIVPERDELAALYRHLKSKITGKALQVSSINAFAEHISSECGNGARLNYFKVKRGIEIFEEIGLLRKAELKDRGFSIELPEAEKTSLENSLIYMNLHRLNEDVAKCLS